jgi:predicted GNAT superfamily acetyltransferase
MLEPELVEGSVALARAAAEQSGLDVREVDDVAEIDALGALLTAIWDREALGRTLPTSLLKALSTNGHYVAGAFHEGRMVGAAVAFFAAPPLLLHSHIAGSDPLAPVTGIGYALKLHQRAWALRRGVASVTWTFDPLVRRNAPFNITKRGARAARYLSNYYGAMNDGRNAGEESDRLLIEWDLRAVAAPPVDVPAALVLAADDDGAPVASPWTGEPALLTVPADIEQMRAEDPALARRWRLAVRDALGGALADGAEIVAFRKREGYVIDRAEAAR